VHRYGCESDADHEQRGNKATSRKPSNPDYPVCSVY
jgi:hypothetical protein